MDSLIIEKSKNKLRWQIIVVALLVLVALAMMITPQLFFGKLWNSQNLIRAGGGLALLVFGYDLICKIRSFLDPTPGMILDEQGYINNISAFRGEIILWSEISMIEDFMSEKKRVLSIHLSDPEAFNNRIKIAGGFDVLVDKIHSPPFFLSYNDYKIDPNELLHLFKTYHSHSQQT